MFTKEQKQAIFDGVKVCIAKANAHYKPATPFAMPRIGYDLRGLTAANANATHWQLNFNYVLCTENWQDTITDTIPHEVAHLIDLGYLQKGVQRRIIFGRSGRPRREKRSVHGDSWASVMRVFGIANPKRCHTYNVANALQRVVERKRFTYRCACPEGCSIGPKHHKVVQSRNPLRTVSCRRCGSMLVEYITKKVLPSRHAKDFTAAPKPQAPVAPPPPKVVRPGTKIDYAIQVLGTHKDLSRKDFITMMIRDYNMSVAGAQTYYYTALKALKAECKAA